MKCIEIITADGQNLDPVIVRVDDNQAQMLVDWGFGKFAPKQRYKSQVEHLSKVNGPHSAYPFPLRNSNHG